MSFYSVNVTIVIYDEDVCCRREELHLLIRLAATTMTRKKISREEKIFNNTGKRIG
jgi:hypothetical protein